MYDWRYLVLSDQHKSLEKNNLKIKLQNKYLKKEVNVQNKIISQLKKLFKFAQQDTKPKQHKCERGHENCWIDHETFSLVNSDEEFWWDDSCDSFEEIYHSGQSD